MPALLRGAPFTLRATAVKPAATAAHPMAPMTFVRSTWLASSIMAIRDRGHYAHYVSRLEPNVRDTIIDAVPGTWLPVELFAAHYRACDALGLPEDEQVALGGHVASRLHGTMMQLSTRLAREAGATPWTLLHRTPSLFHRVAQGGDVRVVEVAPKEAHVELLGYPVAGSTYARLAMRGCLTAVMGILARRAFVRDVTRLCTSTTLGYTVQWA